jgi:ABC-type transport system substrate-binding protein
MRRFSRLGLFLLFVLSACSPKPDSTAEPTALSTPTVSSPQAPAHAEEIRFALIGQPPASRINVWELFDESGSTYANRALSSGNWPRLYHLDLADSSFQPLAADGMPSSVVQEGDKYAAMVKLRSGLKWTDGSPLSADDVAFTANTILKFEFGYDWGDYYPSEYLDHVEAVDASTIKFVFKQQPGVEVWQYGVLQAPVVQKAFWDSAVQKPAEGLPDETARAGISDTRARLKVAQSEFDRLAVQVTSLQVSGLHDRKIEGDYTRAQGEVTYLQSILDKSLGNYAAQVASAQQALHELEDDGEPTLGAWLPAVEEGGAWTSKVNPDFPFGVPNFDRVSYRFFDDEQAALSAFQKNEVDFILSPVSKVPDGAVRNPSSSARFLVFNPANTYLADPAFRAALACMIDRDVLSRDALQNQVMPLDSFVLSNQWHAANSKVPCAGMDKSSRVETAVKLLQDAGYSWGQEPGAQSAGQNLLMSNGEAFPKVTLLAPSKDADALRYTAAKYIAEQAQYLGIPFAVNEASLDEVVYAVFSSKKYDMALVGWQLGEYPTYLCEWFGGQNPLLYNGDRFGSVCKTLEAESRLEVAHQAVAQIEATLDSELPFIPLFTVARADVYHHLSYPGQNILNGWSGLFGAPSYAVPIP